MPAACRTAVCRPGLDRATLRAALSVERFTDAVRGGRTDEVLEMLRERPDLVHKQMAENDERTALHHAVLSRNPEMVRILIGAGADARKGVWPHRDATSAHAIASDRGYAEVLVAIEAAERERREAQVPPGATNVPALDAGADAAREALAGGELERLRGLLQRDPGLLSCSDPTGGLLSFAVRQGRLDAIRLLLELDADVDERTVLPNLEQPVESFGLPLWLATRAGRADIARLLLDAGADPNTNVYAADWPIDHAYARKDEALRRLLLERGARVKPWSVAVAHDVQAAREMLDADPGEALAHDLAWAACLNGCPGIAALALPRITWPPADARWNWFLVQPIRGHDRAGHEGLYACLELLLRRGVDVDLPNRHGETVLHSTMADADLDEPQRLRIAGRLLDAGARLELRDHLLLSTPLGWAARWGRLGLVEMLLSRGALAQEPDAEPWATPLAWAEKRGHEAVAATLRAHGAKR